MKLTGSLKDKVEAVETKEEMKSIIADAGMELTDDELDEVTGGFGSIINPVSLKTTMYCNKCGRVREVYFDVNSWICKGCGDVLAKGIALK